MSVYLKRKLDKSGSYNVYFHGHVSRDELYTALKAARLAVFPSLSEAFALAVLEAMAAGCPVVYTTQSSGPEVIDDGETGLLVDPAQPKEISSAVSELLQDDDLARKLGAAGRASVSRRFSLDTLVPENERFYEACVRTFSNR
jgi:glycosyltransferase involved in cell wall biosynthesis